MYLFNGVNRVQKKGSGTGLDLTGEVSDLYLLWWDSEFEKKLAELEIFLDLNLRFKDDINEICDELNEKDEVIEKLLKRP